MRNKEIKRVVFILVTGSCMLFTTTTTKAQSTEIQQLILDWQKLAELRKILSNMYKGYEIVSKGYAAVKDISEGNFSLHEAFLDKLLEVSPVVKEYKRVTDIISCEQKILSGYTSAFSNFKNDGNFTIEEIIYLERVYSNLFEKSLANLNELLMVITAGSLRMTDDERIAAIDRIYVDINDKLNFLNVFNNNTGLLAIQRQKEKSEVDVSRKLYNTAK
jgi:hypothetical protein